MTSSADGQDRLQAIWTAWSLAPDETMSKAQLGALEAVAKWLEQGKTDPEIVIRAVQLLLADPERPDMRQRACWTTLRKAVQRKWTNAGTGRDHFFYGQSLLLAAWPEEEGGSLMLASLLDSAWELRRGKEPKEVTQWRMRSPNIGTPAFDEPENGKTAASTLKAPKVAEFGGVKLDSTDALNTIQQHSHNSYGNSGPQIAAVLRAHETSLTQLSSALVATSKETAQLGSRLHGSIVEVISQLKNTQNELHASIDGALETTQSKLELLWWGQSRYCRALRKPYLRMKSDPSALLWWTAREAAELSLSVEVEPAAAYLVETLHTLGQDIDGKKSVLDWMEQLHTTLVQASSSAPALSKRLEQIAKEDALGMPVTWVRRRVMQKDAFDKDAAKSDVALHLDEEIDRGEWASWVFRETLLDLHLAENK